MDYWRFLSAHQVARTKARADRDHARAVLRRAAAWLCMPGHPAALAGWPSHHATYTMRRRLSPMPPRPVPCNFATLPPPTKSHATLRPIAKLPPPDFPFSPLHRPRRARARAAWSSRRSRCS
eukprot:2229769-Prymnesium_polylepis.1